MLEHLKQNIKNRFRRKKHISQAVSEKQENEEMRQKILEDERQIALLEAEQVKGRQLVEEQREMLTKQQALVKQLTQQLNQSSKESQEKIQTSESRIASQEAQLEKGRKVMENQCELLTKQQELVQKLQEQLTQSSKESQEKIQISERRIASQEAQLEKGRKLMENQCELLTKQQELVQKLQEQLTQSSKQMLKYYAVGPCGGGGGSNWDDGIHTGIREITIYSGHTIDSISVLYDRNGQNFTIGKHGGNGGGKAHIVLEYPEEYIVHVSGYHGPYPGIKSLVRSLTLKSNKRTFQFGREEGTPFTLMEGGRVVGFMGRSGIYLDAIGCHMAPI